MQIKGTRVYCSLTKKTMRTAYARHQEHGAITHINQGACGTLKLTACFRDGEVEFSFNFDSADELRAIGRVFMAAAELREALTIDIGVENNG